MFGAAAVNGRLVVWFGYDQILVYFDPGSLQFPEGARQTLHLGRPHHCSIQDVVSEKTSSDWEG